MKTRLIKRILPFLLLVALAGGAFACSSAAATTTTTPPTSTTTTTSPSPTMTTTTTTSTAPTTTSPVPTTTSTATTTTSTPPATTSLSTTTTTQLDEAAVRAFADPIVTPMMQGLSEGDYNKYVANADAVFKASLTESAFQTVADAVKNQIGTFESAVYQSWQMSQGYIVVHYKATYTGGTVGIRLVFDSDHLVAGQFFE